MRDYASVYVIHIKSVHHHRRSIQPLVSASALISLAAQETSSLTTTHVAALVPGITSTVLPRRYSMKEPVSAAAQRTFTVNLLKS